MIFSMQLYGLYTDAYFDTVVEQIHTCTPLISLPVRGRIYCGLDDIHRLRLLVSEHRLRAAISNTRHDALLQSCVATPGRVDVHDDADAVPANALLHIKELEFDSHDIERLTLFGLDTIGALRQLTRQHLQAQFGSRGRTLYHFLHDHDNSPLPMYVPPASIVAYERFGEAQLEPGPILESLERCARQACQLLATRYTWRVEVASLDRADHPIAVRERILRSGTNVLRQLLTHLQVLTHEILDGTRPWWGLQVRYASLATPAAEQTLMFSPSTDAKNVLRLLLPRYAHVMRKVVIENPWSVIPEEYGRCMPITPRDALDTSGQQGLTK
jgi:hypothetical protein